MSRSPNSSDWRLGLMFAAVTGSTLGLGAITFDLLVVRGLDPFVASHAAQPLDQGERGDRTSEALAGGASSHAGRLCADGAGLGAAPLVAADLFAPVVTDPASAVFIPVAHPPRPPP